MAIKDMQADFNAENGLSDAQVRQQAAAGLTNVVPITGRKTAGQIIASNVFTLFNLVNSLVFVLIILTGRYQNALFMGVVVSNTLIGIIEEIRARRIIDRLRIITAATVAVRREGQDRKILPEELVLGDVLVLQPGSQVCADAEVLEADELELDESLLTGESEPVRKLGGDSVLSGSFIVAGQGIARVTHVGSANYAQSMTLEARRYKRARSEILVNINRIIRLVSALILPVGVLLFASQYFRSVTPWRDAVISSAAGIIGMIPEGLVLLTSITMTVGIIKLAYRRTVVQELAGLEVLARVNVLCLDKTGTLTKGVLAVERILPLDDQDEDGLASAVAALANAIPVQNSTGMALAARFSQPPAWQALATIPFSSARMWSGASFSGQGTWLIGAPEKLLQPAETTLLQQVAQWADQGYRVVLLASSPEMLPAEQTRTGPPTALPGSLQPRALILLADVVRPEAQSALAFFAANDVALKILTGDNPLTAVSVARQLGLQGADDFVDATTLSDDPAALEQAVRQYTVFGRVTPQRKKQLVAALQGQGKVVAMTGDGTNDVLAMHQADCSIVMASGSDAAKAMAHIALLDSDFTVLPDVVSEGRQVINNVERVASLYLVKTTYSVILSLFFILIGASYIFFPIHQTLLGMIGIGIPSFVLALEKNIRRVQPGFLGKIIRTAVPGGVCIALNLMILKGLQPILGIATAQTRLIAVLVTGVMFLLILLRISLPLNKMRLILLLAMALVFALGIFLLPALLPAIMDLPLFETKSLVIAAAFAVAAYPLLHLMHGLAGHLGWSKPGK